jgi:hypothetical protein
MRVVLPRIIFFCGLVLFSSALSSDDEPRAIRSLKLQLNSVLEDSDRGVDNDDRGGIESLDVLIREGDSLLMGGLAERICLNYEVNNDECTKLRQFLLAQTADAEMQMAEDLLATRPLTETDVQRGRNALVRVVELLERERAVLAQELREQSEAFSVLLLGQRLKLAAAQRRLTQAWPDPDTVRSQAQALNSSHFGHDWDVWDDFLEIETGDDRPSSSNSSSSSSSPTRAVCFPIERRSVENLSYAEYLDFASRSEPFVLTDWLETTSGGKMAPWTLDRIVTLCGRNSPAPLKRSAPGGEGWAGLRSVGVSTLGDFAAAMELGKNTSDLDYYLHDFSLVKRCPELLEDFVVPLHFSRDWLQRLPSDFHQEYRGLRDYWPSLFIGAHPTKSALHKDYLDTAAWMGMFSGHKRWAIVAPHEQPLLRPDLTGGIETSLRFQTDLFDDNLDNTIYSGAAQFVSYYETVLGPGEAIFIPAGSAHQVENQDLTISVAMNFVDGGGAARFLARARENRFSSHDWTTRNYFRQLSSAFSEMVDRLSSDGGAEEALLARPTAYADYKSRT